eukprot:scaffold4912_cov284-Chaetoceros_neogracile.AAC.6
MGKKALLKECSYRNFFRSDSWRSGEVFHVLPTQVTIIPFIPFRFKDYILKKIQHPSLIEGLLRTQMEA